jgi:hypothetical protein
MIIGSCWQSVIPPIFLAMTEPTPSAAQQEAIEQAVRAAVQNGKLPCRKAFAIAEEQGVPPAVVGKIADGLGIRISGCQLGCFP